jgi:hypothetical protein
LGSAQTTNSAELAAAALWNDIGTIIPKRGNNGMINKQTKPGLAENHPHCRENDEKVHKIG